MDTSSRGPLRKIIRRFVSDTGEAQVELECGHKVPVTSYLVDSHKKPGASQQCVACAQMNREWGGTWQLEEELEEEEENEKNRRCACCKARLNSYNTGKLCAPCREKGMTAPRKKDL